MEITIPVSLQTLYKDSHKNYDMALMTLMDSLDPEVAAKAFDLIKPSLQNSETTQIKIGNSATEQIKEAFDGKEINSGLVALLLWVAVLFPEI